MITLMDVIQIEMMAMFTPFLITTIIAMALVAIRKKFVLIDSVMDFFIIGVGVSMMAMTISSIAGWHIPGFIFFLMTVSIPSVLLIVMKCDRMVDSVMGYDDKTQYSDGSIIEDSSVIYG